MLGVGVGLRCYVLCVSFHPSHGPAVMFEPYFLVPWVFGMNVVLLEIGICTRRLSLVARMMAAPAVLLLLSTWSVNVPNVIGLRPMLMESIGCTPLFLTLVAAMLLYAVGLLRRVPHAFGWLTAVIALLVIVGPATTGIEGPYSLQAWPLVLLAVLQLGAAIRYRSGAHSMTAAVCAIAAACIFWPHGFAMCWAALFPVHVLLLAMLLIGAVSHDRTGRFLQRAAIVGIVLASAIVLSGDVEEWSHCAEPNAHDLPRNYAAFGSGLRSAGPRSLVLRRFASDPAGLDRRPWRPRLSVGSNVDSRARPDRRRHGVPARGAAGQSLETRRSAGLDRSVAQAAFRGSRHAKRR